MPGIVLLGEDGLKDASACRLGAPGWAFGAFKPGEKCGLRLDEIMLLTNTKTLFAALLKKTGPDCVCDIGSRDGAQALLFRHLLPESAVLAFEANPINCQAMRANPTLTTQRIEIFPCAISNEKGTARFHITDVDYSDPSQNTGTSSLLVQAGRKIMKTVEVETRRLDEFMASRGTEVRRMALWIDVEGAEYGVLEGMAGLKDRVVAVHVEASLKPLWEGQRTLAEVSGLMASYGFELCGSNIRASAGWGDVVFVRGAVRGALGFGFTLCRLKGYLSCWLPVDGAAVWLKRRFPWLYGQLRRIYLRVGT